MEPPVIEPVRAVASRTTRRSRSWNVEIDKGHRRTGRGVLVAEVVVDVDPVVAVDIDGLVDDPRRDGEVLVRLEQQRGAEAQAAAAVPVILDRPAGRSA